MKIQVLDKSKKKKFVESISDLGIKKIRELLVRSGKERIRAYSGNLSVEEIMEIWRALPVEGVGLYVGKEMINRSGVREVRLSVDGLHAWEDQVSEKIIQLTEEQEIEWFKGKNVELDEATEYEGFVAVKSSDGKDFIGTAKVGDAGKTLYGFLPKERCRKSQVI